MLTLVQLRQSLLYVKDTGDFIWLTNTVRGRSGEKAGHKLIDGYIWIGLGRKKYPAHRLAWFYSYGTWPEFQIDHIDGQKHNNALSNLRDVPATINMQNRAGWGKFPKGVYQDKTLRFRAMLQMHGKLVSLGTFDTIEEAEAIVSAARIKRDLIQRGIE